MNKNTVFRATASETKADSVTRIAKGMIDAETSARQAKTQRLRTARHERDVSEKALAESTPKKMSRKNSKTPSAS